MEWDIIDNPSAYGNNSVDPVYGTDYNIVFSKESNKIVAQVQILDPLKFIDDETYTAMATLKNANGTEVRDITVQFKKAIPTEAPQLNWNASFDPTKQVFSGSKTGADIYKVVEHDLYPWVSVADTPKSIELNYLVDDLTYGSWVDDMSYYKVYVNNKKGKVGYVLPNQADVVWPAVVPNQYKLSVAADDIDGKPHNVAYSFDYGRISLTFDYQTAQYAEKNVVRNADLDPLTFASWIDYEVLKWTAGSKTITYIPGSTSNFVTINLTGSNGRAVKLVAYDGSEKTDGNGDYELGSAEGKNWAKYSDGKWYWVKKVTGSWQWMKADGTASIALNSAPTGGLQWTGTAAPEAVTKGGTDGEIKAYNTVVPNTQSGEAVFGTSAKPVGLNTLIEKKYIDARIGTWSNEINYFTTPTFITVSFSNDAFKADIDNDGNIKLTQQPTTTNPVGQTGTLYITGKDCFGHSKTWSLDIKIQ